ncbi:MAG: site-specific integrase [Polyangiaceae bacterium]
MPDNTRPYSVFEGIGEHERERAEQAAMTAQDVANSMRRDRKRASRSTPSAVVNATARVASPVVEAFTVRRYCEELWIPARERRGLPSVHDDKSRLRTHIYSTPLADGSTFGARPIAHVSAADLRAVVASLDDKIEAGTMAGKTARNVWGVVTKLFADAANSKKEALRVLPENPAKGIQPPERGTARERHVLYPSEVLSFLSCDRVPLRWKVLFALAVYTYVRDGELEELRWKDVDLEHRSLYVNRAVDRYRDVGEVRSTKTKRNRKVDIEPALLPLLKHLKSGRNLMILSSICHPRKTFREA